MHVYQMRSSNQSIVSATQQRISTCMNALRDVSRVWLVAKMVHTLFESILGNKVLEERLQKAAGRRHTKNKGTNGTTSKQSGAQASPELPQATGGINEGQKRKFDDMELGYVNGPPAPQMSYERSRPQSPALTPQPPSMQQIQSQPPPQQQQIPHISSPEDFRQSADAFMGASRGNTRPTTPFNMWGGTRPATPDLFLHTRNSPKISDDLWQNYAPEQLFPPEANGVFSMQSPSQTLVDPALRGPPSQPHFGDGMQQTTPSGLQPHQQVPMQQQDGGMQQLNNMNYHQQDWSQLGLDDGQRADDNWSTSSTSGPIVPTTLNVEDWFAFFGMPNGDLTTMQGVGGYG
jgi:hypothetical protein